MRDDRELAVVVDVIGSHYAGGVVPNYVLDFDIPIWSSEDGPWTDTWNTFVGGSYASYGTFYNLNYIRGRMTATHTWTVATGYYNNSLLPNSGLMRANEPWSGHYRVMSPVWITAHTTQFAQPGWQYLRVHRLGLLAAAAWSPLGHRMGETTVLYSRRSAPMIRRRSRQRPKGSGSRSPGDWPCRRSMYGRQPP